MQHKDAAKRKEAYYMTRNATLENKGKSNRSRPGSDASVILNDPIPVPSADGKSWIRAPAPKPL